MSDNGVMDADITILHNPRCSTSRAALEELEAAGRPYEVTLYLKQPLTADQLRALVALFPDDPTSLVRRDAAFARLGLSEGAVRTPEQIVEVLAQHPELLQRPVLIRHDADGDRAIIGRPKEAVPPFVRQGSEA